MSSRTLRNHISIFLTALFVVTFISQIALYLFYFSNRPSMPIAEGGYLYPLSGNGLYAYLTDVESAGMTLLFSVAFFSVLLAFAITLKRIIDPPPSTPRWMTYLGASFKTDLARPTRQMKMLFGWSFVFWLLIIYFAGTSIARYAVSSGHRIRQQPTVIIAVDGAGPGRRCSPTRNSSSLSAVPPYAKGAAFTSKRKRWSQIGRLQ
jgi:hypothetical protein